MNQKRSQTSTKISNPIFPVLQLLLWNFKEKKFVLDCRKTIEIELSDTKFLRLVAIICYSQSQLEVWSPIWFIHTECACSYVPKIYDHLLNREHHLYTLFVCIQYSNCPEEIIIIIIKKILHTMTIFTKYILNCDDI